VSDGRIGLQIWYGVSWRRANSYRTLLAQAGLSLQRTQNTYRSRPNDQTIADFDARLEKKTDKLQVDPQLAIMSLDEMSLYFQATLTRVDAPTGQTPMVRVTPRDPIHFYGALEVRTGREVAASALEQTADCWSCSPPKPFSCCWIVPLGILVPPLIRCWTRIPAWHCSTFHRLVPT
jgi:hypothetical protein